MKSEGLVVSVRPEHIGQIMAHEFSLGTSVGRQTSQPLLIIHLIITIIMNLILIIQLLLTQAISTIILSVHIVMLLQLDYPDQGFGGFCDAHESRRP